MTLRMDASGTQSSVSGDGSHYSFRVRDRALMPTVGLTTGAENSCLRTLVLQAWKEQLSTCMTLPLEDGDEGSKKTESSSLPCRILREWNERKPVMFVS